MVGVAKVEPQALVVGGGADDRAHVRQAGASAQPGLGVDALAQWEDLARQGFTAL
ncbi:hypothetical protein D3C77_460860 [compost metagenome]